MKRIIIAITLAIGLCSIALAQKRTEIVKDSTGKVTVTKTDSEKEDKDSDTTFVADWQDTPDSSSAHIDMSSSNNDDFPFNMMGKNFGSAMLVPIVAIIMVFGLPVFIIFITFFFRYKNKKAKYRLVEQALAAGQPIPEGIFKEQVESSNTQIKGIKNSFLGLGLFIFLWALTGEFGLGCIGLLIMFTGLGQITIHYTQKPKSPQNPYTTNKHNTNQDEEIDQKSSEEK